MKKVKFNLIILLALITLVTKAQTGKPFLDTVEIACNEQVHVKIAVYDNLGLQADTSLAGIITGFQENLNKVKDMVPEGFYKIIYKPGETLVIEKLTPVSKYMVTGESVIPVLRNNIGEIKTEKFHLFFSFSSLEGLLDKVTGECISTAISQLPGKTRYALTYHYSFDKGMVKEEFPPSKNGFAWDMMNITAGIGAGLVKNALVTDIGLELGFNFNKKGVLRNGYYLSDNLMYLFDDQTDRFAINNFLNIGYRYNFSKNPDKREWIGPEIGFPVYKEGEFFKDNIFRAAVRWQLGNSVYVSGQLYVNKGFKSAYPGLRIGFWF